MIHNVCTNKSSWLSIISWHKLHIVLRCSQFMMMICLIASLGLIVALHVKRTEFPINMYLLAAFTLVESYTVGTVVTFYKYDLVAKFRSREEKNRIDNCSAISRE